MKSSLDWFDGYVKAGFQPVALYRSTKCPTEREWNQDWSPERWRHYFRVDGKFNMGIILGDIIDVEGDTEEANDILTQLIGDVPHPMFSSKKSIHHLFKNPGLDITRKQFNGMEFRAYKHQSCVPPSFHQDGPQYKWITVADMPTMPANLHQYFLENVPKTKTAPKKSSIIQPERIFDPTKRKIKPGYCETQCRICKELFYIHKKRIRLEVRAFRDLGLPWMCHGCREIDVREQCRVIRKALEQEANRPYVPLRED